MKAIEIIETEGKRLGVLVETKGNDETKGYVSYFIDGLEITDFSKLVTRYQRLFNTMADNLCKGLAVTKYSY